MTTMSVTPRCTAAQFAAFVRHLDKHVPRRVRQHVIHNPDGSFTVTNRRAYQKFTDGLAACGFTVTNDKTSIIFHGPPNFWFRVYLSEAAR